MLKIVCKLSFLFFLMIPLLVLSGCGAGASTSIVPSEPARPAYVSISLAPASVLPGQSATLTWSSGNVTSCTGSGGWTGTVQTSGSMTVMLQSASAQSYTLQCSGESGLASQTVTLAMASGGSACGTSSAARSHFPTSRAVVAARKAVASGTAGRRRPGQ